MKYSLAYNWDSKLLSKIKTENKASKNKIVEFFGSCDYLTAVPSRNISKMEVEKKIQEIKNEGFSFNYLLNSISAIESKKLWSYISWISTLNVDIITVANEKNIFFLNENFPSIPVNISIVSGVDTIKKVEHLLKKYGNIKRITLKHSLNRDQNSLKKISKYLKKKDIEVELLANELCFLSCPLIKKHYKESSGLAYKNKKIGAGIDDFSLRCNAKRISNFISFVNTAWIRPEDVKCYRRIGINIIKIAGKTEATEYLHNTAKSFLKERHNGNMMNLFSEDWWPYSKKPSLDNRLLDGFLENIWNSNLKKINKDNLPQKYKEISLI